MKIGYILPSGASPSPYNGIRIQAETWADEILKRGHELVFITPWERYDWKSFDLFHVFGQGTAAAELARGLNKVNSKIVCSPIIDTIYSVPAYFIMAHLGCQKLRIGTTNYNMRLARNYFTHWFVRSEYELSYVNRAYGVPCQNISIIPLSYRIEAPSKYPSKELFCLHVSKITDDRKNVMRLIKAAIKYGFKLVLVGSISNEEDYMPFRELIEKYKNITYLGRLDDEKLKALYMRAKVFALPSISEGVGLVALEAAACGCDIVITNIGGPKEYYDNMAFRVSPYSVDEIGQAILSAMNEVSYQPHLMRNVKVKYNLSSCVDRLINSYKKVLLKE